MLQHQKFLCIHDHAGIISSCSPLGPHVWCLCRRATAQLKGGWWCVATARRRATEFSASWATITDRRGSAAARWGASPSTVPRELRTSTPTSARYPQPQNCEQGSNVLASQLILRNVKQMFSGLRRPSAHLMATVSVTHMEFFPFSSLFCISRSECITLLPPPREELVWAYTPTLVEGGTFWLLL